MTLLISRTVAALAVAGLAVGKAWSQELEGADSVLRRVTSQMAQKAEKRTDAVAALQQKLEAYDREAKGLAPKEAADRWLAMWDAYLTIPQELLSRGGYENRLSAERLIRSLPPREAWRDLAAAIANRTDENPLRSGTLAALGKLLTGDSAATLAAVEALDATVDEADEKIEDYDKREIREAARAASAALLAITATDSQRVAAFEKQLRTLEKRRSENDSSRLQVPDLVKLSGRETATPLIARALRLKQELKFDGEETRKLAVEIALRDIASLTRPPWELIQSAKDVPLYEALAKAFPDPEEGSQFDRGSAGVWYLRGLIASDRVKEAVAFLKAAKGDVGLYAGALSGSGVEDLRRQGFGPRVLSFLTGLLRENPTFPFWRDMITLAAQEHQAPAALSLLREAIAKPDLKPAARVEIEKHLYTALLAANEVEGGVKILRELVNPGAGANGAAGDPGADQPSTDLQFADERADRQEEQIELALKLVRLGMLLDRDELVKEGLAAVGSIFKASLPKEPSSVRLVVETLLELGRHREAEELVTAELLKTVSQKERRRGAAQYLALLCKVYDRAGRSGDILTLLEKSTLWGASDLAFINTGESSGRNLFVITAEALASEGQKEEARRVALRAIELARGNDAAYAALMKVGGPSLKADLDRIAAGDRFEERPLIWKAKLRLEQGDLAEAERIIRAAISIDPSDGEQGKGDRMRAYAVLADVLEKKGDREQAAFMRRAVGAIRLSEKADDWWAAGLLSRAVEIYDDALNQFADAYCIQSRLALRHAELGDWEKAERHYRRAFELMPESFGRVESHCFGCEGAFSGKQAQGIADQVFQSLALKFPDRAQIHYLLGYLRDAQGREEEAADLYRKAVAIDPDYLNAWVKLQQAAAKGSAPMPERQKAAFAILRLDPMARHAAVDPAGITDLAALWSTVLATEDKLPHQDARTVFPLPASRAVITSALEATGGSLEDFETMMLAGMGREKSPRMIFLAHPVVEALISLLDRTKE